MTTNVPQDVIDLVVEHAENGNWPEFDAAIELLRAQRQQGAEPVAWLVKFSDRTKLVSFTKEQTDYLAMHGSAQVTPLYTTPPQANALVAAAYRKAAELIMPKEGGYVSPKLRHLTAAADEVSKLNAEIILNSIPADAEAALREVIADAVAAGADNIEGYDLTNIKPWDDVVNSVMEGKDDE
jgi:hypothetical protein